MAQPAPQQPSLFGASPFGQPPQTQPNQQASLFGSAPFGGFQQPQQQAPFGGAPFGGFQPPAIASSASSQQQLPSACVDGRYMAATFEEGKIPEVAPPQEACQ
eukprot:GHVO01069376.1.p2 GENE.GHVO01069376.1~~GHVO01069376.1.p2  ORF type:complete len:103 (+),score=14.70 GHVO01069376.1:191-499(+)